MSAIVVLPIRLFCDLAARNQALVDLSTGAPPVFYRGDDLEIDIGIGQAGALLAPNLSNITSVTCQIFANGENDTNPPVMSCTVLAAAMNLTLTAAQWSAESAAPHAAFIFPNAQTVVPLNGQASANMWLRITCLTADATPKVLTLLDGAITVLDGPVSTASPPGLSNARFFTVAGRQVLQILNDTDGYWYSIGIEDDNGVPSLYVSDNHS
ncbi:MAG: hypothetical protein ABSC18_08680 [Verrucomicrobiota bacterium]|jgi:hypothetical protein